MRLIYTITFLLILFSLNSQGQNYNVDSLKRVASTQSGKEKLTTLGLVCVTTAYSSELIPASIELEKEARIQNSDVNIARAYFSKLHYYCTQSIEIPDDSILHYAGEANKHFGRAGYEKFQIDVEMYVIRRYTSNGDYELALNRGKSYLERARNSVEEIDAYWILSDVYHSMEQPKESLNAALKGLGLCEQNNKGDVAIINRKRLFYLYLTKSYIDFEDYTLSLDYSDKYLETMEVLEDGVEKNGYMSAIYVDKTRAYIGLKQYKKALKYIKLADERCIDVGDFKAGVDRMYALYYFETKEYTKSLIFADKALAYYDETGQKSNYIVCLKQKADILDSLHKYQDASILKTEMIELKDTLAVERITRQAMQIKTIYEVDKLEREKIGREEKLRRSYIVGVAISIVCLLAMLLFAFEKRNSKRLREKNRKLFEQYKHLPLEEINSYTSPLIIDDAAPDAVNKQQIYNKVVEHLLTTQQYVDSELTREALALQVGTNRQYLIEAIQENANMTYTEFLSHLRLEHARKLLLQDSSLTIERIYQSSGFNNKSTFYKHFGLKYGMTPAEFKSFVSEENAAKKLL